MRYLSSDEDRPMDWKRLPGRRERLKKEQGQQVRTSEFVSINSSHQTTRRMRKWLLKALECCERSMSYRNVGASKQLRHHVHHICWSSTGVATSSTTWSRPNR